MGEQNTIMNGEWDITITHDGMWPTPWHWAVDYHGGGINVHRWGDTFTKKRAERKAIKAKLSILNEDIRLHETGDAVATGEL